LRGKIGDRKGDLTKKDRNGFGSSRASKGISSVPTDVKKKDISIVLRDRRNRGVRRAAVLEKEYE